MVDYVVWVKCQEGSENYNKGIKSMVWAHFKYRSHANELVNQLKETGLEAHIEEREERE